MCFLISICSLTFLIRTFFKAGLAHWGPKKHLVKVKSRQEYERLITRYVGYPIRIDNAHGIEVDDVSSYKDRVKITRVPFEMTQNT